MHPANETLKILERRKQVQEMWLRGRLQWEIARDLAVSRRTVVRDLEVIIQLGREWIKERQGGDLWEEIAKLNRWEAEANDAWERSKKDAQIRTAKVVKMSDAHGTVIPGDVRSETSKREEGKCGDVRYLTEARNCAEQRCRLLGYFVNKNSFTTSEGQDILPPMEVMVVALLTEKARRHAIGTEPAAIGTGVTAPAGGN